MVKVNITYRGFNVLAFKRAEVIALLRRRHSVMMLTNNHETVAGTVLLINAHIHDDPLHAFILSSNA